MKYFLLLNLIMTVSVVKAQISNESSICLLDSMNQVISHKTENIIRKHIELADDFEDINLLHNINGFIKNQRDFISHINNIFNEYDFMKCDTNYSYSLFEYFDPNNTSHLIYLVISEHESKHHLFKEDIIAKKTTFIGSHTYNYFYKMVNYSFMNSTRYIVPSYALSVSFDNKYVYKVQLTFDYHISQMNQLALLEKALSDLSVKE